MNPLTNVKNIQKLNERELELGIIGKKSWHDEYADSAWVFIGGLPYDLTEGDIICVFSQYGEIVNLNLIRDHKTGKSKGYGFLCYEDQRSTVLAVDNLNGIKILFRTIRVDHVKDYKIPKDHGDEDDATLRMRDEGCAPKLQSSEDEIEKEEANVENTRKQIKKEKKSKKQKKKKRQRDFSSSSNSSSDTDENITESSLPVKIKQEKFDKGYEKPIIRKVSREQERPTEWKDRHKLVSEHEINRSQKYNRDKYKNRGSSEDDNEGNSREKEVNRGRNYHRDRSETNGSGSQDTSSSGRYRNRGSENYKGSNRERERDIADERVRERDNDRQRERSSEELRDRSRNWHGSKDRYRKEGREHGKDRSNDGRH